MPTPRWARRPACSCNRASDTAPPTLAQLTAALDAAGIAKFKWPERLEAIAAMPLTPTQKIMRGRLKDLLKGNP